MNCSAAKDAVKRDLPVTKNEMEFEIQFAHDGDSPGLDKYHVHIRCFAAWEFERRKVAH